MKAIVCTSYGPPSNLKFLEVPDPLIGDQEVLVEVKACGVNFPDTLIVQGLYQSRPQCPFIPGRDIAGVVIEKGKNVKNIDIGDHVMAMLPYGGFAQKVAVNHKNLYKLPYKMNMQEAASFQLAYNTVLYALKDRAKLKPDETLLVLGAAGGLGIAAIQIGKLMGARVIAAASTPEKLELCRQYGADEIINYSTEDLKSRAKVLTQQKGVDVVFDPVGGIYAEQSVRVMAWEGRYLVVGFTTGKIPHIPLNIVLLKSFDLVGVFWSTFNENFPLESASNIKQLLQWYEKGNLKPHIDKSYSLSNTIEALEELMNRNAKGKLVISM